MVKDWKRRVTALLGRQKQEREIPPGLAHIRLYDEAYMRVMLILDERRTR